MPELRDDNTAEEMKRIFVTGISTEVGKTVAAAVIAEALEADYWKPIQAGDLEQSDSDTIRSLIGNPRTRIHPNAYALATPMSPHAAAQIDGIRIELKEIRRPETDNHLVIEGAGGLLVPLNDTDTITDLIRPEDKVILVSRHYLGSINHSLLSLGYLKSLGMEPAILFVGDPHPTTQSIIVRKTEVPVLGRLPILSPLDASAVRLQADALRPTLESWLLA